MDWRQLAYWNSQGSSKSFAHPLRLDWLAPLAKDARVLDYGCGYGRNLQALHDHGRRNTMGVDFAAAMIARARGRYPHLELKTIEGLPLDEPDGAFDAVLLFAVLTCIPGDEDQKALLAELIRLLRPGGLIYISDYPLQSDARNRARYEAGRGKHGVYGVWDREDGGVFRHHERGWLAELLSGFEELKREELETVTMGGNAAIAVQILGRKP